MRKKMKLIWVIMLLVMLVCHSALAYSDLPSGSRGEAVEKMQLRLTELGYYERSIDGDYGNMTKTAVKAFQAANGLEQTGEATADVLELLYSDEAIPVPPKPPIEVTSLKKNGAALTITFKNNLDVPVKEIYYSYLQYSSTGSLLTKHARSLEKIAEEPFSLAFSEYSTLQPGKTLTRQYFFEGVDPRSSDVTYGGVCSYVLSTGETVTYTLDQMRFTGTDGSILYPLDESEPFQLTDEEKEKLDGFQLGVTYVTLYKRIASDYNSLPGFFITEVTPDSLVDLAGLRKGDMITAFDEIEATASYAVERAKLRIMDGNTVTVYYRRNNENRTVEMSLDMDPVNESTAVATNEKDATSILDELQRCGDLLERGLITQEEYDLIKQKLLGE